MSTAAPAVSIEDVVAVTQEVWSTLLGLELDSHSDLPAPSPVITGCVQITGSWEGAVFLSISEDLGRIATEAMFASDDVSDEDVIDAVGELTNMVGGNVKSLLPAPSQLSVPSVATGERYKVHVPGTSPMYQLVLGCGKEAVSVSVWYA